MVVQKLEQWLFWARVCQLSWFQCSLSIFRPPQYLQASLQGNLSRNGINIEYWHGGVLVLALVHYSRKISFALIWILYEVGTRESENVSRSWLDGLVHDDSPICAQTQDGAQDELVIELIDSTTPSLSWFGYYGNRLQASSPNAATPLAGLVLRDY